MLFSIKKFCKVIKYTLKMGISDILPQLKFVDIFLIEHNGYSCQVPKNYKNHDFL